MHDYDMTGVRAIANECVFQVTSSAHGFTTSALNSFRLIATDDIVVALSSSDMISTRGWQRKNDRDTRIITNHGYERTEQATQS